MSPTVERPGDVSVFYTDDGSGIPVLLHTGSGGDSTMWSRAGYHDVLDGRRLLAMDHRGHGRTMAPTDVTGYRPGAFVADVLGVLDDAGVDQAVFVGYSFGASVLCRAASEHPGRCLAFVGLGFCPEEDDAFDESPWPQRVRAMGTTRIIELMAQRESEPPPAWFLENLCATSDDAFALPIAAAHGAPPLWDVLLGVQAPTLLVGGSEEIDDAALQAAAARVQDGTAARLEGYGHLQLFWHAEVTGDVVTSWLVEHRL